MEIRAAHPSEQATIEAVVAAAFDENSDGSVVQMIRALNAAGATRISLVAVDDRIVGHAQLSKAWIDARSRLVDALMLTPLSVVPERQRQGVGTRLLEHALRTADELGVAAVFLEGDWAYYGVRGFVSGASLQLLRPSLRIPEPAFQVAPLSRYESSMTGHVIYPEAMWETDSVGLRDPRLATIENALNS
jgi:putative acetyltransferase